jgi:hypothetical protein
MPQRRPSGSPDTPDDAMNRALESEQRALDAIAECEREAAKLIDSAQQQARSLVERTDRRIQDLHLRCVRATDHRLDAMLREDAREAEQAGRPESRAKALEAAVLRLATRLSTHTHADDQHD